MNTRELKEALKVAAQWAEWQQESLDDFHAYAQMFGARPGGNVFDFVLGDALKLRGLTWNGFHQTRVSVEKRESKSSTVAGEQGVTST